MRALIAVTFASLFVASSALAAQSKVWVAPFEKAGESPEWMTRTLQQSLTDELATLKTIDVQMSKEPTGATHIVKASVQRSEKEIRITGRVEDPAGKNLGGFKATGSERDLFGIEDGLATQVAKIVAPDEPLTTTEPAKLQPIETPFAPAIGGFEGSDLQRSMKEGVRRQYTSPRYSEPPTYQQPMYPVSVGLGNYYYNQPYYGNSGWYPGYYGGYWGYGLGTTIIINKDHNGGTICPPGHTGSIGFTGSTSPNFNGQAIRHAASFGGAGNAPSAMVNTAPGPPLVPGGASTGTGALPAAGHGR
jgi:TolB-like protein